MTWKKIHPHYPAISGELALRHARRLRCVLLRKLGRRTITAWGLDNPYMSPLARRVMLNEVLRQKRRSEA